MSKTVTSLSDPIYSHLLQAIMSGQIRPGARLTESHIATRFGVSRTPVRDALRKLREDGLIDLTPHHVRISSYSPSAVRDIGILRLSLDSMAIKLSLLYGNQLDFLALLDIAKACEQAMLDGDQSQRRALDCDFHRKLAEISGNHLLFQMQNTLNLRVNFILLSHMDAVVNANIHVQQHFEIVDALMQHDEVRALQLISLHLRSFYNLDPQYPPHFFNN